tara:strand:+ start:1704 stop:1835 length:132 start_codon:yes stop_codon:yes gene_type:complete
MAQRAADITDNISINVVIPVEKDCEVTEHTDKYHPTNRRLSLL